MPGLSGRLPSLLGWDCGELTSPAADIWWMSSIGVGSLSTWGGPAHPTGQVGRWAKDKPQTEKLKIYPPTCS